MGSERHEKSGAGYRQHSYGQGAARVFGGNLDALYDALGDVAEPTNLVLRGAPASDEMAAYLPRLTRVLEDAAAENRNVELTR